jgi:MarR family transcriptional regulator, 2-MHQ and catechol-resistance regulon repressor
MKIEEAIGQTKPMQPLQKAMVNLIFTYNWQMEASAAFFKPFGVTAQQYNVLRILRGRHPQAVAVGDVKAVMLDRNPDLTRLCDRLLEKDLIERTVNGKNRREVLLTITEKGIRLLDEIEPAFADATKTWDNLTPEEYETLSDLLDKLRG